MVTFALWPRIWVPWSFETLGCYLCTGSYSKNCWICLCGTTFAYAGQVYVSHHPVIRINLTSTICLVLAGDYAECLTLLMRGAQFRNPAMLVQQAQYLHDNLSEHGGLHILQQNDLQSGKPPRASLWDGTGRPDPAAELRTSPSNRIKHRKSHGANLDGLASITRGVMKSPQVRDLNKAIAGVMGTVQVSRIQFDLTLKDPKQVAQLEKC